jgi:hypothetical protein
MCGLLEKIRSWQSRRGGPCRRQSAQRRGAFLEDGLDTVGPLLPQGFADRQAVGFHHRAAVGPHGRLRKPRDLARHRFSRGARTAGLDHLLAHADAQRFIRRDLAPRSK